MREVRGRREGVEGRRGEEKPLIELSAFIMEIKCSWIKDGGAGLMSRLTAKGQDFKLSWIDARTLKNPIEGKAELNEVKNRQINFLA